jgi:hypothetical protein
MYPVTCVTLMMMMSASFTFAIAGDSAAQASAAVEDEKKDESAPGGGSTEHQAPAKSAPGGGETTPPEPDVCILGCVTLLGSNEKVSITEVQKGNRVDYEVTVLDEALTVTAFGVTNIANDDLYTEDTDKFWGNEYLSESAWNAGFQFYYLGSRVLTSTSALGLFDDLFGLKEDHVAFFYLVNNRSTDGIDSTAKGFSLYSAVPKSQFAAFSGNNLVSQSVPEPSTLAILALGLVRLGSRRFKKQS